MGLEPIGAITILVGLFCLLLGTRSTVVAFVVFCTLGSAAAILIGGANIQPAHLFLLFLAASTLFWRRLSVATLEALKITEPGFWLLCLVLYGVLSSYVMPRLFAGLTYIVPLGATEHLATSDGVVPLGPVSSNFTQPIYLIGDLVCFVLISTVASTREGINTIANALIAYAAVNLAFGVLDLATSATGTQHLLQFIRNAQYTFHDEETVGDMRRIIGSWPEASAFAGITLAAFGFTGMLWLSGRQPLVTGPLALLSLMFVILSTSSTGLVGSVVVCGLLYAMALRQCSLRRQDRFAAATVIAGPLLICLLVLTVLVADGAAAKIYDYLDTLVLSKGQTSSGVQRATWNAYAWRNFIDSWGLGVGLGTNRTSSFPLAVLSNVGIPGAVFYVLFMASIFGVRRGQPRSYPADVRTAARIACLSLLTGGVIAGPTVDQSLLFYILAGAASALPEHERVSAVARTAGQVPGRLAGAPVRSIPS